MVNPVVTRRVLQVEHIKMETTKKFVDVEGALEQNVPQLDPALRTALPTATSSGRRSWNGVYRFSYF